jgi:hypothetical protein
LDSASWDDADIAECPLLDAHPQIPIANSHHELLSQSLKMMKMVEDPFGNFLYSIIRKSEIFLLVFVCGKD